jgi:hypothetical protein
MIGVLIVLLALIISLILKKKIVNKIQLTMRLDQIKSVQLAVYTRQILHTKINNIFYIRQS